jgi:hypothetical protein
MHGVAGGGADRSLLALLLASVALLILSPAAFAANGSISGTVTEATGGKKPIPGANVTVWNAAGRKLASFASTAATGEYKAPGLAPGSYKVAFEPAPGSIFAPQYYNDAFSFLEATEVTIVTEGEEKPGINAALREGGKISGKVEGSHGERLQGIHVYAFTEEFFGFAQAKTNANGEYTLTGLAKGSYKVEFEPEAETNLGNLVPQFYEGANSLKSAKPVPVKEEETKENVNAVLHEGGEISGTVTDAVTHAPLGEVCVSATNSLGFEFFGGFAVTAANGQYTIHGLGTGLYNLAFEYCGEKPGVQFITQFVNSVSVTPGSATAVNVALIGKAPVNTAPPVLSGTPAVGQKLSCSRGSWTGVSLVFTYAWLRDSVVITGASANTYVVQPADQGHALACQVTATNSVSRVSATSNKLNVPAPPPPAPAPRLPPLPPLPPVPTVESVTQSNSVWSEGSKLATFSRRKTHVGTTISFVLNEPASVSFAFTQQLGGRKVKGRCVAQTKKNRHKPSCRRTVTQGTLSFAGHTGLNRVVFQGRISPSKRLGLGAYTLQITATNSVGEPSSPRSLNFTIVK